MKALLNWRRHRQAGAEGGRKPRRGSHCWITVVGSSGIPTRPHFLHFCHKNPALGRVVEFCHNPVIETAADCILGEAGKFIRIAAPYRRFDIATER